MVDDAIFIDINKLFIDINKDGIGHITKRMLPTEAKELVHLTCNRVRVYIYHAKYSYNIYYSPYYFFQNGGSSYKLF